MSLVAHYKLNDNAANSTVEDSAEVVGHWKLNDDAANTTVADSSGKGNTGTLYGGDNTEDKSVTGKIDKAFSFNGTDDYVRTPTINLGSSFTISFWIKPTNLHNYGDALSAGTTDKHIAFTTYADGHINYRIGDGSSWGTVISTSAGTLVNGTWYHIIGTYNGSQTELFINGVSKGTASNSGYSINQVINIGARTANSYYFEGLIDDVRIYYNTVLTSYQRAYLYNNGSGTEGKVIGANNGTLSNGLNNYTSENSVTGKINKALSFDGTDDYVRTPTINLGSSFTISFWIKPTNLHNYGDALSAGTTDKHIAFTTYADGHINYIIGDGSSWGTVISTSAGTLVNGTWYHIIGTYNGSQTELFINGVSKGTASNSGYSINQAINIGARGTGRYYFDGLIDDVRIYNDILGVTERQALYQNGRGTEEEPPLQINTMLGINF